MDFYTRITPFSGSSRHTLEQSTVFLVPYITTAFCSTQ